MAEQPASRQKTILCVDDNEPGLEIRQMMLEIFSFRVLKATSGREALRMSSEEQPDAVVLDFHMPEMNGAELAEELRKRYPTLPLIMLTGYSNDVPPRTLQLLDAMIAKGERPEKLLNELFRLTGSPGKRQPMSAQQITRRNAKHIAAVDRHLDKHFHREK